MTHDDPTADGTLAAVFEPRQVAALSLAIERMGEGMVTRADFERLEGLVRELLARTPPVVSGVTPEEIVIIAAAVTTYLGKRVRVRGARRLAPSTGRSAWGHQGRVHIQASHQLGARKGH
jgi:hypothetical protein